MSNKDGQERKLRLSKNELDTINTVLSICNLSVPLISPLWKVVSHSEVYKLIFDDILIIEIIYGLKCFFSIIHILLKKIKQFYSQRKELFISCNDNEEKKKKLYYNTKKLRKKIVNQARRRIMPRFIRLLIAGICIFALCITNPLNSKAFWQDMNHKMKVILGSQPEEKSVASTVHQKANTSSNVTNVSLVDLVENQKEKKPPGYRFILTDPDSIRELDSVIEALVYFYNDDTTISLSDLITEYLSDLKQNRRIGIEFENLMYDEEDEFKSKVAKCKNMEYLDDWFEVAPTSDELDDYINKRMMLIIITIDGKQGSYEVWWRLANDCQYYAQEYEMQTNNESAVLYYYTMSIYCCMKAFEYEMSDDMYDMIYHYMAMRYHDICRDDCIISGSYKKMAELIYSVLEPDAIN